MARVVIVCGYDRFADIDEYAERVAARLAGEEFEAVIVSGGFTSSTSRHSEAWLMSRVLARTMPEANVLLEECSMTTLDNLVHSRDLAAAVGPVEHFTVFCDLAHRSKVVVLSRIVLGRRATVYAIDRRVPWFVHAIEPFSIACESIAAVSPPLRRAMSRCAAWVKGVSGGAPRSTRRRAA